MSDTPPPDDPPDDSRDERQDGPDDPDDWTPDDRRDDPSGPATDPGDDSSGPGDDRVESGPEETPGAGAGAGAGAGPGTASADDGSTADHAAGGDGNGNGAGAGAGDDEDDAGGRVGLSRRALLAALAAAGALGAAGGATLLDDLDGRDRSGPEDAATPPGDADVEGADVSGEATEHLVRHYFGPLEERPPAGEGGRVWESPDGALYLDDGTDWRLVQRQFAALRTDRFNGVYYASSAVQLSNLVANADSDGDPMTIVVTEDVELSRPLATHRLPDRSVLRGSDSQSVTFTHSSADPCVRFDSQNRVRVEDLQLRTETSTGPLVRFDDSDYVPYKISFDRVVFEPLGGGIALASGAQPWGMLFTDCDFRMLSQGGGPAYVMCGGVNNTFTNCLFSQVPAGAFAVRPSPSAGAESWLFENCTFGGFFASEGGAFKGVDYDNDQFITPVRFVGTSFEGLDQDREGFAVETAGATSFANCWFRDLNTAIRLGYQGPNSMTIVENCRFDERIRGYDVDASNRWHNTCRLTPLRCSVRGYPRVADPTNGIYGEEVVASGSVRLRGGSATVDTGVGSQSAVFDVSLSGGTGVDSRVAYDIRSGTHRVELRADGPASTPVNYLVVQRRL
jgi:hypothetical protein